MGAYKIMSIKTRDFVRVAIVGVLFILSGCGGDKSSITSGGGNSGVTSDGGSSSSALAGTYKGTVTLTAKGSKVDNTSTRSATLLVRSDGTARLTIDEDQVIEGFMNGNKFGFSVRVIEEDGLVECSAEAILTGTISGGKGSGSISGSGKCKILTVKTGFDVSGKLSVTRV